MKSTRARKILGMVDKYINGFFAARKKMPREVQLPKKEFEVLWGTMSVHEKKLQEDCYLHNGIKVVPISR